MTAYVQLSHRASKVGGGPGGGSGGRLSGHRAVAGRGGAAAALLQWQVYCVSEWPSPLAELVPSDGLPARARSPVRVSERQADDRLSALRRHRRRRRL